MKAILINAEHQTVSEVTVYGLADMQKAVGGLITVAYQWKGGDVLYVDDEGLLKKPKTGFSIPERTDQPFAGNGLILGSARSGNSSDVKMDVNERRGKVEFVSWEGGLHL